MKSVDEPAACFADVQQPCLLRSSAWSCSLAMSHLTETLADNPSTSPRVYFAGFWCFAAERALTEDAAFEALSKVLGGSQYREAARKVSCRMQARKRSPLQEAGGMVQPLMLIPDQSVYASPDNRLRWQV